MYMDEVERIRQLEVEACLAMRDGKTDSAERSWQSIVIHAKIQQNKQNDENIATVIKSLQNLLQFASRSHNDALFESWLMPTWKIIRNLPYGKELGEFVNAMAFVIADHKIETSLLRLEIIFKEYVTLAKFYHYDLELFFKEWLETAAEITSRGADKISRKLIILLVKGIYKCSDWKILQSIMWQYYMHMQAYAHQNGYKQTFEAYGAVHYLEILLNEQIMAMPVGVEQKAQQRFLYSGIRDWLANIARITGKDEGVMINEWKSCVINGAKPKLQQRFQKLFDAEMEYWHGTRPKTYAKIKDIETMF